jgi:flap endonuclease-1
MDMFIDICILCGCDYTDSIRGIGPKKAFEFIKRYKNIETLLAHLDKKKYPIPESGFHYEKARALFTEPEVTKKEEIDAALKWTAPDEEALIKFMVEDKGFAPERVAAGIKRIKKSKSKGSQGRLDSFFKVTTSMPKAKPSIGKKGGKGGKKKTGPYANR